MKISGLRNAEILVVGGAGFVGSNLVKELLKHDVSEITVVDNLLSSERENLPEDERLRFVCGSITEDFILGSLPSTINLAFHLACFHGNQSSIFDPIKDHDNNLLTSLKLFEKLKDAPALHKLVYASAACAVAEKTFDKADATTEDQPLSLFHDSPYSISKIAGELYGNYYFKRYELPFVKARFSNVYGPGEILGAGRWRGTEHTVWRNVIPSFIWRALNKEALPLENGGNASRDFIFVEDIVQGLIACALKGDAGEVYNLASGRETSILELAVLVNQLTGNPVKPDLKPARTWDRSGKRFASTQKSQEKLGFTTSIDLETGLARTIDWTIANQDLIQKCISRHDANMHELRKDAKTASSTMPLLS